MKPRLSVAVRTLVAFTLQSGDLETTFGGSQRSLEGIRAHQKIQRARPSAYAPEVTVRRELETDDVTLELSGRIDGVYREGDQVVIEEIKSTYKDLERLEQAPDRLHWVQAQTYAWMYASQH